MNMFSGMKGAAGAAGGILGKSLAGNKANTGGLGKNALMQRALQQQQQPPMQGIGPSQPPPMQMTQPVGSPMEAPPPPMDLPPPQGMPPQSMGGQQGGVWGRLAQQIPQLQQLQQQRGARPAAGRGNALGKLAGRAVGRPY